LADRPPQKQPVEMEKCTNYGGQLQWFFHCTIRDYSAAAFAGSSMREHLG